MSDQKPAQPATNSAGPPPKNPPTNPLARTIGKIEAAGTEKGISLRLSEGSGCSPKPDNDK